MGQEGFEYKPVSFDTPLPELIQGISYDGKPQAQSQCKDYFAADVGHIRRRDSVVGSRSQVLGSEKGGEGRGRPLVTRRGSGRQDRRRTELNK